MKRYGEIAAVLTLALALVATIAISASFEVPSSVVPRESPVHASTVSPTRPLDSVPPDRGVKASQASSKADPFYMREGFTLVEEQNNSSVSLTTLSDDFTIQPSPYATAYELDGLADNGDWFQVAVASNWPIGGSCPAYSNFAFVYDLWNNTGFSVAENCITYPGFLAGDQVILYIFLNYDGPNTVFLLAQDTTGGFSVSYTHAFPDPDATYFLNLGNGQGYSTNANGYFTGMATEVADASAASCLSYTSMPEQTYYLVSGSAISKYIPWSDEYNSSTTNPTSCYDNAGPVVTLTNSPISHFYEATGGSTYGPHWESVQNWTVEAGTNYVTAFKTDVAQFTFFVSLSQTTADVNQRVNVTGSFNGGASPYSCEWFLNGTPVSGLTACAWTDVPSTAGRLNISGYGVDGYSDFVPGWVYLSVASALNLTTPVGEPSSVDLGQVTTFMTAAKGGSGSYVYVWSGLPSGCASNKISKVTCTPTSTGSYAIYVNVTDSNGFTATSERLSYTVYSDPTVGPVSVSRSSADVGQPVVFTAAASGGSGGYTYAWNGLPTGCTNSGMASDWCTPAGAGTFSVTVTVTDSNGFDEPGSALTFTVNSTPTINSFRVSPGSVLLSSATTFDATAAGGKAPLTYSYFGLPSGCSSTNVSTFSCTPSSTGTFNVEVVVLDANGLNATKNVTLTVNPEVLGLPAMEGYALIGGFAALVAVAVAVVVLLALSRRKRRGSKAAAPTRLPTPPPGAG